ncbi:hypothetical protein F3J17_20575 [Burkholderia sp. Ax-1719]|nr:hypothetical protein [Burkholderia sp. Ax-1719]
MSWSPRARCSICRTTTRV